MLLITTGITLLNQLEIHHLKKLSVF